LSHMGYLYVMHLTWQVNFTQYICVFHVGSMQHLDWETLLHMYYPFFNLVWMIEEHL
jgi:hypothetical protein